MSDSDGNPTDIPSPDPRLRRPADPRSVAPAQRRAIPPGAAKRRAGRLPFGMTAVHLLVGVVAVLLAVCIGLVVMLITDGFGSRTPVVASARQEPGQPAQPKIEVTKTATYGDWIYTCVKVPNVPEARCGISQQLSDAKSKAPLFLWRIVQDGKGGYVGEWQTRSGIMVDRGIVMEAGTDKPVTVPFEACLPEGCRAVAKLTPDAIAAIGKAQSASATVFPVGSQPVKLTLSVKGLSDALAALQPAQPAPTATPAPAAPAK